MRLLVAGGGTGGHLYPGIAVARAWLADGEANEVLFVGTARGIEARVLPREDLPFQAIFSAGVLGRSVGQRAKAMAMVSYGFCQAMGILRRFRPHVVLGVGGYSSVPSVAAAGLWRKPIVLIEQNVVPGVANRLLSRFASKVAVGLPVRDAGFARGKIVETGLPLRSEFSESFERGEDSWSGPLKVLIFGGSQGARAINEAVMEALPLMGDALERMRFVHQTGEADFPRVQAAYQEVGAQADVAPYLYDMAERYRWAQVCFSRAGAMSVAELSAMSLPAVLIPFPSATHGHQEANARYLAEREAARMILQEDLSGRVLADIWLEYEAEREKLVSMSERTKSLARTNASEAVAALCRQQAMAA